MKRLSFFLLVITIIGMMNSCGIINRAATNSLSNNLLLAPYDVIIVPGVPYDSTGVNQIYKARMLWAKWLYDRKVAKNIIFSGSAVHTPYVEGKAMKIMADSLGIPPEHTFVESRAEHSTENIDFGIQVARQYGFKKIAVATDPFQSRFIRRFMEACKINIALIPFPLQMMPLYYKRKLPKINAQQAYVKNFVPLEKREIAER